MSTGKTGPVRALVRRQARAWVTAVVLALIPAAPAVAGAGDRMNIILVTFDSLGARYLPFHGFDRNTAPNLTKFAAKSHVFTDAVSQGGSTSFSLGSLFTSRYPLTDHLMYQHTRLRKNRLFLPRILKEEGYHTWAVVRDNLARSELGFDQGFDHFDEDYMFGDAGETFQSAIGVLKGRAAEPFFLWIHNEEPHSPYLPPEKYFREFYRDRSMPTVYDFLDPDGTKVFEIFHEEYEPFHQELFRRSGMAGHFVLYAQSMDLSAEELKQLQARYLGNIKYADAQFGKFLKFLRKQDYYDRTLIIVTADHGESLGAHGVFDHNDLYQDIIHVPLIVRLPGQEDGRVVGHKVELVDIYPTITRILGLSTEYRIRGEDLFAESRTRATQFSEAPGSEEPKGVLIEGDIKYWCEEDGWGYYDLAADPGELERIPADPETMRARCDPAPLPQDIFSDSGSEGRSRGAGEEEPYWPGKNLADLVNIGPGVLDEFQLFFYYERPRGSYYHARRSDELLKLEVTGGMSLGKAADAVERELFQVRTLFADSFSPYPEEISNRIQCPDWLQPRYFEAEVDGQPREYFITFSNDRYGIGICSEDLIRFQYLTGWIHCPDREEFYRIRYYIPRGGDETILHDFFKSLECR